MYRIVIADDEQVIRKGLLSMKWSENGMEVIAAAKNGVETEEIIDSREFDVLLTDIKMPGISGLELARNLAKTNPNAKTILLTGYGEFEYAKAAVNIGVFDYILKPSTPSEIMDCVKRACARISEEQKRSGHMQELQSRVRDYEQIVGVDQAVGDGKENDASIRDVLKYICANYQDELTGAETAFGGDEIRSLKKDSYLVLECQAQGFKYWTPFPGQLRLQAYSHLASGAASVMYWNWHSIHNGYETYWKGILSHDLSDNPTYEEAGIIGAEFKRIGKENLVLKKKNKAAVLVDNRSLTAFKWFPIDKDLSYNDVVRWMYDALYEMNLECDIVHAGSLDPAEYRIIVTPALYSVDEQLIRKLTDFVHAGGILISSFKSFCADRNLSVYHDAQPHGMTDVFGMTYNQFTIPGKARLRLDGNGFDGKEYTMEYFAELLRTKSASDISASYDHRYWGIYAGITRHHYGNGTAYYIGCYTDKEVLKKIYAQAFADAGMSVPPVAWPVIVRSGLNEKGNRIHYVLHYSEETEVFCCPYRAVTDLVSGRKYKKGDEIRLTDWSVCVLEESPEEGEADTND